MSGLASIFGVGTLDIRLRDRRWPWADANRDAIAHFWREETQALPRLFDGSVLLFADERVQGGTFQATCFRTSYSNLLYWKRNGFPDRSVSNGFAMAALQAADGAFLLGEMASHTAARGQVYFPAGTPDPSDLTSDAVLDLDGSVTRELEEETGLARQDYAMKSGWIVVREEAYIAFMRPIRLPEPADAARTRMLQRMAQLEDQELSDIRIVRSPDEIDVRTMPGFVQTFLRWSLDAGRRGG